MTNVALLSALYGQYEWVKPITFDLGAPSIMVTDDPTLETPGWGTQVLAVEPLEGETWADPAATRPMMEHKLFKCRPEIVTTADIVIWVDASITILVPDFVDRCLEALGDDDWAVVPHPGRSCVYTEAEFSGHLARYDKPSLDAQAAFYRTIGHPDSWGLFATGFSVRRMTDQVKEIGEQWWWECTTRTHQDQVSLPVLFRLAEGLKWNNRLPWGGGLWSLTEHGR